jgi:hypothetical protein
LIEAVCDLARKLGRHRIALLVEVDSAAAKRLYERLGFCTDYTKCIAGQEYFHMVRSLCCTKKPDRDSKRENFQVAAIVADVGPNPQSASSSSSWPLPLKKVSMGIQSNALSTSRPVLINDIKRADLSSPALKGTKSKLAMANFFI